MNIDLAKIFESYFGRIFSCIATAFFAFLVFWCLFKKIPLDAWGVKIYTCADTVRNFDTVRVTSYVISNNSNGQKVDLKGVNAMFLNLGTTFGNSYSGNTMTIVQDTEVDIKKLPAPKQQLTEYTQGILGFILPALTEDQKSSFFQYLDSSRVAHKLDKNVTLAIDKKSDGIIVYFQLLDLLTAKGYSISDNRFTNLPNLSKLGPIFWDSSGNHLQIVVGKIAPTN